MPPRRKDRVGEFRTALEKNKRIIFKTQCTCGICGLPVDMDLKYPDPMSKTVDHIIPIAKGGHPSDLSNLQLAHRWCNRQKSDKLFMMGPENPRPLQNNPRGVKMPGAIESHGAAETTGIQAGPGENQPDGDKPGVTMTNREVKTTSGDQPAGIKLPGIERTGVDNNNLPQHADWSTLHW